MRVQGGEGDEGDEGDEGAAPVTIGMMTTFPMGGPLAAAEPSVVAPGQGDGNSVTLAFSVLKVADDGYPASAWDPMLRAQIVLAELGATDWTTTIQVPKFYGSESLTAEIQELFSHVGGTRQSRLQEIIAQAQGASGYFGDLLMLSSGGRKATRCLIATAFTVGQMVGMYFKSRFMRPRPSQLYPALMPPIPVPGHPAYPNAHALQCGLTAEFITRVCPPLRSAVWSLAVRIAENREIAGLHYPSDKRASWTIIPQLMLCLTRSDEFNKMMTEAGQEWT
jgi:hypothetical protein